MTTCLILCRSPFAAKTAQTHRGTESTRPLKMCCGIWHQDVSSRSFKSCKLWGGASIDRTCLSSASHRCSIGLRSGEFGACAFALQTIPEPFLLCDTAHYPSERGYSHQGIPFPWKGVHGLQQCLGRCYSSVLLTSPVSGHNVMPDQCINQGGCQLPDNQINQIPPDKCPDSLWSITAAELITDVYVFTSAGSTVLHICSGSLGPAWADTRTSIYAGCQSMKLQFSRIQHRADRKSNPKQHNIQLIFKIKHSMLTPAKTPKK